MGCPTSYDGRTATWSKGRLSRLSSGSLQQGMENFTYSYNAYGQRVSKSYSHMEGSSGANPIPNGELIAYSKQFYYDHAGRLLAETASKTLKGQSATSENIVFLYDEGTIIGMEHTVGGTTSSYYFHRSPMGDVVGIYNTSGALVAKYLYDAWGNCTIASGTTNYTVANANPIRYRGYYYDDDTGLYYCNARYYSPKWRRFISPDDTSYLDPETVNGLNLYCYCGNDPVNRVDPSGRNWESFWSGVGEWFTEHWVEFAIGTAFIIGGAVITALTAGAGTSAWAAFGAALLSSTVQVGGSIAVGVGVNGLVNIANGNSFFNNVGDTIASSYMWGGILSGAAQMIGGGFRYAANRGIPTGRKGGIKLGNAVKVLSPDANSWAKAGGTLIKFGNGLRFDIGAMWGLHVHILNWHAHIPIGMVIAGLIGA